MLFTQNKKINIKFDRGLYERTYAFGGQGIPYSVIILDINSNTLKIKPPINGGFFYWYLHKINYLQTFVYIYKFKVLTI